MLRVLMAVEVSQEMAVVLVEDFPLLTAQLEEPELQVVTEKVDLVAAAERVAGIIIVLAAAVDIAVAAVAARMVKLTLPLVVAVDHSMAAQIL